MGRTERVCLGVAHVRIAMEKPAKPRIPGRSQAPPGGPDPRGRHGSCPGRDVDHALECGHARRGRQILQGTRSGPSPGDAGLHRDGPSRTMRRSPWTRTDTRLCITSWLPSSAGVLPRSFGPIHARWRRNPVVWTNGDMGFCSSRPAKIGNVAGRLAGIPVHQSPQSETTGGPTYRSPFGSKAATSGRARPVSTFESKHQVPCPIIMAAESLEEAMLEETAAKTCRKMAIQAHDGSPLPQDHSLLADCLPPRSCCARRLCKRGVRTGGGLSSGPVPAAVPSPPACEVRQPQAIDEGPGVAEPGCLGAPAHEQRFVLPLLHGGRGADPAAVCHHPREAARLDLYGTISCEPATTGWRSSITNLPAEFVVKPPRKAAYGHGSSLFLRVGGEYVDSAGKHLRDRRSVRFAGARTPPQGMSSRNGFTIIPS